MSEMMDSGCRRPGRLMVLDVAMPVLDGLTLLDKLDNSPRVVFVTAREYDA
jgi:CheY-like chemotaxis protein